MKCISVIQPWAHLILGGVKEYETRGWRTAFRGRILVHASTKITKDLELLGEHEPFYSALGRAPVIALARGAILGSVEVVDCVEAVTLTELNDREKAFGDFRAGRWAWRLRAPLLFPEPVPYRGRLGVYDVGEEVLHPEREAVFA